MYDHLLRNYEIEALESYMHDNTERWSECWPILALTQSWYRTIWSRQYGTRSPSSHDRSCSSNRTHRLDDLTAPSESC